MGRHWIGLSVALLIVALQGVAILPPAAAQTVPAATVESLQQELDAQKAINERLRRRIADLEASQGTALERAPALRDPGRPVGAVDPDPSETTTAIREALVARGLLVLPPGAFSTVTSLTWINSGSSAQGNRSDTYAAAVTLQAGLPGRLMVGVNLPYQFRDTSLGSNRGWGDPSVFLAGQFLEETGNRPSLVASFGYQQGGGGRAYERLPIGSLFSSTTVRLSAVKRFDPVVVYGDASYSRSAARRFVAEDLLGEQPFSGQIAPRGNTGVGIGASLVATPDITLDVGLNHAFIGGARVASDAFGSYEIDASRTGFLTVGSTFLIGRSTSLSVTAGKGLTVESADHYLSVGLGLRF
jgi:hypothetical protein